MKTRSLAWPVVLLVLLMAGCSRNNLVGEWEGAKSEMGMTVTIRLSLNKDGGYSLSQNLVAGDETLQATETGTYSVDTEAGNIVFQAKESTVAGQKRPVPAGQKMSQNYALEKGVLTLNPGKGLQEIALSRVRR